MSFIKLPGGGPLIVRGAVLNFNLGAAEVETPVDTGTTSIALLDFIVGNAGAVNIRQRKAGTENDANGGNADVVMEGTFTGAAPNVVQARVVDSANQATVIKDWTNLTGLTVTGNAFVGTLPNVPAGGKYLSQIRVASNTALFSNGTVPWGVGVVMIDWGQSNMLGTLLGVTGGTLVPGGAGLTEYTYSRSAEVIVSFFEERGWALPDTSASSGRHMQMRMVAKALEAKHGKKIPVGLVVWAYSNQSIDSFLPGGIAANRALFTNTGTTSACGMSSPNRVWSGDVEMMNGHHGEANNGNSAEQYKSKLIQLADMMVAKFAPRGRSHQTFKFMPAVLGVFPGGGVNSIENIRQGVLDFEAHAIANGWASRVGWTTLDCKGPPENTLHFQGDDQNRSLKRMIQSDLYKIDPTRAMYSSAGPRLTGTATRSGDVVTLPVVGGVTLEPLNPANPVTGWQAHTNANFDDALGTDVALTNVTAIAGAVQVTATGAPATFYIKHCGNKVGTLESANSDISNLLYQKVAYPMFKNDAGVNIFTGTDVRDDFPLYPTPIAIMVTA